MDTETKEQRERRLLLEGICARIRNQVDQALKGSGLSNVGFTLTLSTFGDGGDFAYASNIHRQDVIKMFREVAGKLERGA
jgi:hypothetical protein